jgi:predicted nucleotidyltransferase component of viral defense system
MEEDSKTWHAEVMSPQVADTAERLVGLEALRNFYLAGGTALALHLGHRRSVDLDFFSADSFDEDALVATVQALPEFSVVAKSTQTLYLHVSSTKVSFIGYSYPLLFPLEPFRGLAVAEVRDIACMKLSALASRGSRRDFVDFYFVAQRYGLPQLLEFFQRKFAHANYSVIHVQKSLVYFADAEKEPMPDMLLPLSWEEVMAFFCREVRKLSPS